MPFRKKRALIFSHGEWSLLYIVELSLLIFCWGFLYLYLSGILTWNFPFLQCLFLFVASECCYSVAKLCPTLWNPMDCSTSYPSLSPGVCSNSCTLSWWCHPTISSSVIPFSSCLQSSPATGSFPMSQFFASGGQVLEFQLQHQSFQWLFSTYFL